MRLDLEDERIHARISGASDGRTRLVLEYPAEPDYRDAVLTALADLLRTAVAKPARRRGRPRKEVPER